MRRLAYTLLAVAALNATAAIPFAAARDTAPQARLETVQYAPWRGSDPKIRGGVPGRFDYYALVMSWSPSFCASEAARPGESQCRPRARPFAFVLHGLWPQHERGYPEYCPSGHKPFVPERTIDSLSEIMPSRNLVIHQYRKHGVCSGLDAEGFFAKSRELFQRVKVPQRFSQPMEGQMVDISTIVSEFVAANPGMKPDGMAVVCGSPGPRLREIRICMDRDGKFRSCGDNESQRRLCNSPRVFVPPVRQGRGPDSLPRRSNDGPMLPGPTAPASPGQRAL